MSKDDVEMMCLKASKTLLKFCDDKSSSKDMTVIKQARTVFNFLFNGETYEQPYVADRLNKIKKLMEQKMPKAQIAKLMGCTWTTLNRYIKENILSHDI